MKKKSWFTVGQVHPRVFALAEFSHWEKVVSYLVVGKRHAILFDSGMGYADLLAMVATVTPLPVTVFLTHGHWDHIGSVHKFEEIYLFNHPFETDLLSSGFSSNTIEELVDPNLFDKPFTPRSFTAPGIRQYHKIHDGETVSFDTITVTCIHTPGHTPGSACYKVDPFDILVTGDTIYSGPLYANLPESNLQDYAMSVNKLARTVTSKMVLLPGHNAIHEKPSLVGKVAAGFCEILAGKPKTSDIKGRRCYGFGSFSVLTMGTAN
ncbi:MBL fold metallo-hydrolase [Candidatus Gottesmanbacteria bacterium]|nr:MBL fold metallo-hydrolase [Candidatus Gottesmanbacteria bacterium]